MTSQPAVRVLLIAIACAAVAPVAAAQETRLELIADQQAEKATQLRPYEPNKVERALEEATKRFLEQPSGFIPYFDSVYSGGGFTLGAGYRHLVGERSQWYIRGLYSFKNYKLIEIGATSPDHLGGRLTFTTNNGWRDATQVGYFGLGMDTSKDDRTNAHFSQAYVSGLATFRPIPFIVVEGGSSVELFDQRDPQGSYPPIESVHTPATAPALGTDIPFLHLSGRAGIDTRTSPGYTRSGGYYGVGIHSYNDLDDVNSFNRIDLDLIQHIPIVRETWVFSLRGRVQTTLDDDDTVPFFLMPSVGGGSSLRAYQSWRFRDRHTLLTSAEWRWFPNRLGFDMALFFDAGKVTADRADLDFRGLQTDWGVGARFHGPMSTVFRLELARGSEGWNTVWAASPSF